MKQWKAYVEMWNIDITYFRTIEFDIPDDLYTKVTDVIAKRILLKDSDIYGELLKYVKINEKDFINEDDLPYREDYDTEEEFLEEYNEELDNALSNLTLGNLHIDDPNELLKFKNEFIGKRYPDMGDGIPGSGLYDFNENGERNVSYLLEVYFSEDGTITDIEILSSEGCEWEGIKNSSYSDCYPNYDFLSEQLKNKLDNTK